MECDFCGNRYSSLPAVCCPSGDKVCPDCVRRNLINTSTMCGTCGVQIGKKIKTLIQQSLKAPISNSRNARQQQVIPPNEVQGSFHRSSSQYFGNHNQPRYYPQQPQQQYHPNMYNQSPRFMQINQDEWNDCPQMMNPGRMNRGRLAPNQMQMMNGYSMQGCMNGEMQYWDGMNQSQSSWNQLNELSQQFEDFTKNPNFGIPPIQGRFQQDPNELIYSNGQMIRQQNRIENFTTDSLNESGRSPGRMTRSNSSINIRRNNGNNF